MLLAEQVDQHVLDISFTLSHEISVVLFWVSFVIYLKYSELRCAKKIILFSANWVPLDEYYYGKKEGDPVYREEKGEFRFKVRFPHQWDIFSQAQQEYLTYLHSHLGLEKMIVILEIQFIAIVFWSSPSNLHCNLIQVFS